MKSSYRVYHWIVKRQAAWALRALARNSCTSVRLLASALQKTCSLQMTEQEKAWIDRIEQLRTELASSSDTLVELSYGPHTPRDQTQAEDLIKGNPTTRKIAVLAEYSSQPFFNAYLQFRLIREFRPAACLELGTSLGLSGAYLAAALACNENDGRLTTLEASAERAKMAHAHFERLGLTNVTIVEGRFQNSLPEVFAAQDAFAWASKDAQHTEAATIDFFRVMLAHLEQPALLVFDDINWSLQMRRAWRTIRSDRRVNISVDLRRTGVCLIDETIGTKYNVRLPIIGAWLPHVVAGCEPPPA